MSQRRLLRSLSRISVETSTIIRAISMIFSVRETLLLLYSYKRINFYLYVIYGEDHGKKYVCIDIYISSFMRRNQKAVSLFSQPYKTHKHFDKRFMENKSLRHQFPEDIPLVVLVVHAHHKNDMDVQIHKLLISKDKTYINMLTDVTSKLGLNPYEINVERGDKVLVLPSDHGTIKSDLVEFYKEYRDKDGFIYLVLKNSKLPMQV